MPDYGTVAMINRLRVFKVVVGLLSRIEVEMGDARLNPLLREIAAISQYGLHCPKEPYCRHDSYWPVTAPRCPFGWGVCFTAAVFVRSSTPSISYKDACSVIEHIDDFVAQIINEEHIAQIINEEHISAEYVFNDDITRIKAQDIVERFIQSGVPIRKVR